MYFFTVSLQLISPSGSFSPPSSFHVFLIIILQSTACFAQACFACFLVTLLSIGLSLLAAVFSRFIISSGISFLRCISWLSVELLMELAVPSKPIPDSQMRPFPSFALFAPITLARLRILLHSVFVLPLSTWFCLAGIFCLHTVLSTAFFGHFSGHQTAFKKYDRLVLVMLVLRVF